MKSLNENIFHQYNKWKTGYVRKETTIEKRIKEMTEWVNEFFDYKNIDEDFEIDIDGITFKGEAITIDDDVLVDGKLPYPFVSCKGSFSCDFCRTLVSLEGMPITVDGKFECSRCTSLTSLIGAPEKVGGSFDCNNCPKITSLEGAPKEVGGDFDCGRTNITSFEHIGTINGGISCNNCTSLTSFKGLNITKLLGDFSCCICTSLTSLVGAPQIVIGDFQCWSCDSLLSLEGAPEEVGGVFNCSHCKKLTSLVGGPVEVDRYICAYCDKLISLEGAPEIHYNNYFDCRNCSSLVSVKGLPDDLYAIDLTGCKSLKAFDELPKGLSTLYVSIESKDIVKDLQCDIRYYDDNGFEVNVI